MGSGLIPPDSVVATWPPPNFVDPETRGPGVMVMEAVLLALCYIVLGLRLWARFHQSNNFGYDDALIIINMLPLTGIAVSIFLGYTRYGLDKHVWDNTTPVLVSSRKGLFALVILHLLSTSITKVSVLLFYRRLGSRATSPWFRYAVLTTIGSVFLVFIIFLVILLTTCNPIQAWWGQVDPAWKDTHSYQCYNEQPRLLSSAIVSMLQDFIACFLPMLLFWKLKLSMRQKLALQAIFGVGLFVCVCGIMRVTSFNRVFRHTYDYTWSFQEYLIWTAIEVNVAVICASAPALHYFLRHVFGDIKKNSGLSSDPTAPRFTGYSRTRSLVRETHNGEGDDVRLHPIEHVTSSHRTKSGAYDSTFLESLSSIEEQSRTQQAHSKGSG